MTTFAKGLFGDSFLGANIIYFRFVFLFPRIYYYHAWLFKICNKNIWSTSCGIRPTPFYFL